MKRDDDLIRKLLFEFESSDEWQFPISKISGEPPERNSRQYHIHLLCDLGYLVCFTGGIAEAGVFRMTSQGHDFLDAVRDDGIWSRTKDAVRDTGGSATVEIVKALAMGFLKKKISQHTGIEL
ncbi:MAG: DUF2513 domain-containing protein [Phaeovulum sp.]|uniref:DUF2513 domain-containing protein n=1 Tax=Phaeovulum sp. TaxID=2934796 RepID=UPI00273214AF|nr:DUF2513 domain-containing protein [Phaeovulum sp.]MDP2064005.1 DUF2513 domain-containing protein [Phaeovulum sp.]